MGAALASSALTFFSTLAGGTAALRWPRHVKTLMALAGGVVLAAAFLDLLPEAIQRAIDLHMPVAVPLGCVLLGYLTFQALDILVAATDLLPREGGSSRARGWTRKRWVMINRRCGSTSTTSPWITGFP